MLYLPEDADKLPLRLGKKIDKTIPKPNELEKILEGIDWIRWALVGSHYINGAGKDIDLLVLKPNWRQMIPSKWIRSDGDYTGSKEFYSYRFSKYNLLVVTKELNFNKFLLAAKLSKVLGLSDKAERVALHEAIRHNNFSDLVWELLPKTIENSRSPVTKDTLKISVFDDDIPF